MYISKAIFTGPDRDIYTGQDIYIFTGLCTGQNTGHHTLGQTHFGQGQGQDTTGFGVDRGQRKRPKIGDTEMDNSHNKGDMGK